jgi:hypothetical protein
MTIEGAVGKCTGIGRGVGGYDKDGGCSCGGLGAGTAAADGVGIQYDRATPGLAQALAGPTQATPDPEQMVVE